MLYVLVGTSVEVNTPTVNDGSTEFSYRLILQHNNHLFECAHK
jgi:hypothetical protein